MVVKGDALVGTDKMMALAVYKEIIRTNLDKHNGLFRDMIRSIEGLPGSEVYYVTSRVKRSFRANDLPSRAVIEKIRPLFSQKEYLLIQRVLERTEDEDPFDLQSVELAKQMTVEERLLQRELRKNANLAKLFEEERGNDNEEA